MNIDPRPSVIAERLKGVKRVLAVTGWKGGIGKSVTATTLALLLAKKGYKTGLFDLDFAGASGHLVLDMPPGINDAALDVMRFARGAEVLAVTVPSVLAHDVLARSLELYKNLKVPVLGVIENMADHGTPKGAAAAIKRDPGLEKALGRPGALLKTAFARDLAKAAAKLGIG